VASDGAGGNACGGTNSGYNRQGVGYAHGGACEGASICDSTHGALTGGSGGSLKGNDGRSQGNRSDTIGGDIKGRGSSHDEVRLGCIWAGVRSGPESDGPGSGLQEMALWLEALVRIWAKPKLVVQIWAGLDE
jgi:hypothetical protein